MGRVKEFDPDAVLDTAMRLFWQRGYEATSTADLVAELGIARASLYATFGSKHELYLHALDRYLRERDPAVVERLSGAGPALPAVRELVESYAADAANGCFVVNAAVERMADGAVARRVRTSWDTLEVALTSALLRARAQGELRVGADPRATARFLLVFLQGIRVIGPDEQNPERLADAVRSALTILD
jgi:TetR/AcrR family transcriptional repressor of nem operon